MRVHPSVRTVNESNYCYRSSRGDNSLGFYITKTHQKSPEVKTSLFSKGT